MNNKIRYLLIFIISIVALIGFAKTISIADFTYSDNTPYTKSKDDKLLKYNGKLVDLTDFAKDMGSNSTKRSEFINTAPDKILYAGFYNKSGTAPIEYKSTICMVHNKGSNDEVYRISTVIDIDYDPSLKAVVMRTTHMNLSKKEIDTTYATQKYAGEISYSIYLNDKYGSNDEYNIYKSTVDWYLQEGVKAGYIKAPKKFGERSSNDKHTGSSLGDDSAKQKALNSYSKKIENYKEISSASTAKPEEKTSYNLKINNTAYTIVGAFKLSFNSENPISSITVNGKTTTDDTTGNVYWSASGKSNYGDASAWGKDWKKIPANTNFYLAVKTSLLPTSSTSYKIKFTQTPIGYYRARMILLESSQSQQFGTCLSMTDEKSHTGSVEFEITRLVNAKITVEKVNGSTKVKGVKLKIYGVIDSSNKGWVKTDGTLASSYSGGSTFTTGDNGTITADKLKVGKYYVYEVGVPSGYDLEDQRAHYADSKDPNKFAGNSNYGNAVYLNTVDVNGYKEFKLTGVKQYGEGSITVEKVNKDDTSKKLKGAKLKVYADASIGKGWVKTDGTIASDYASGATFTTGDNGTVKISNLRKGTYYVYEIGAPSGYNLEDQRAVYTDNRDPNGFAGKSDYGNAVYLGKTDCNANAVQMSGKKQYPGGSITIEKVNKDDANIKIKGVQLKIYADSSIGKGWLKTDGSLASDYASGSTFTTGDNGTVTISDVRKGTYYVYEIGTPSGYDLEDQRSVYTDDRDPNGFAGNASYGNAVYLGKADCSSNTVQMTGKKQYPSGSITIEKVNKDDANQKVQGVQLKIYGDATIGKGWLKSDGSLASDYASGDTFTTDANGQVKVNRIKKGTYYVYEIGVPEGYDLEDQRAVYPDSADDNKFAGNASYGKGVYIGKLTCSYNDVALKGKKQYQEGSFSVEKVDKNDTNKKVQGVQLKIYGDATIGKGWLKTDGTLVSDFKTGDTFTTDSNGVVTASKIRKGTYYIYEVALPDGYDLEDQRELYADSNDPNEFAGKDDYGKCVYIGKLDSNSNTVSLTGKKQYPEGSITIEKVNKNDTNVKVSGVQLKIYGEATIGKGWLKSDGSLASDYASGATFTTDENGQVKVTHIRKGTYYVYEIGVPDGYDLEDQREIYTDDKDPNKFAGNASYGNGVYIGTLSCSGNDAKLAGVKQYPEGKIIIEKVDSENANQKIQGVKIKVYGENHYGKGWVTTDGKIVSDYSQGSTYVTGADGKATIEKLKRGTYHIYEIDTPEGYDLEDQRILYPDSRDSNNFAGKAEYDDAVYLTTVTSESNTVNINGAKQKAQTPRDLTITKIDKDKNEKVSGTGFKVLQKLSRRYRQKGTKFAEGTYVWLKEDGTISEDINDAYEFKTGSDGTVTIKNILTYGTCYIYEVTPGGDFELIEQEGQYLQGKPSDYQGEFLKDEWVYAGSVEITVQTGTILTLTVQNEHSLGSLEGNKVDATYKQDLGVTEDLRLTGAKFKLYGTTSKDGKSGWVQKITYENGKYKYGVGPYSTAEEFTTDEKGQIHIDHLKYGTYYAYETAVPQGYNMKEQDGYHKSNPGSSDLGNTDWVYVGTFNVNFKDGEDVTYDFGNYKYVTEVKGKVWLDVPDTKANLADNLYNSSSNDQLLSGITVNLYNRKTGAKLGTTTTNSNGEYVFNEQVLGRKVTYWELANCYVEFIYDNTKYITVNPFEGGANQIKDNSKVQEEEISDRELDDNNLTGTTGDTPGIAITLKGTDDNLNNSKLEENAKKDLKDRLLTGYYDDTTYTIENINLGLVEKVTPDHTIGEELEYVKIQRGNYTFKYKYGEEAVTEQGDVQSTVKFQNSKKSFTQSIYPSDIKYNIANGLNGNSNDAFKVYVVYKIEVKNLTTFNLEDLYQEQALYLRSLTNSYDTSRYELSNAVLPGDDENISKDFGKWTGNGGTASYDVSDSSKKFSSGIAPNETESAYIEFKVTDEALKSLVTEEQLAESPTVAKSVGYHKYNRKDKNWKDNRTYTHTSVDEERENGSLYLKWKLFDTRTISGQVFEDAKDSSRPDERVGDGKYDSSREKTVSDVIVSLINAESDTGEEAYIYEEDLEQNPATGKWSRCKQKAVTKVDENGKYSFKGVVPGRYYLKFTYGDGNTTITDLQGNIMTVGTKISGESNVINSNYYKSTILTGAAKDATNENEWFLNSISEGVYSIGTDSKAIYYNKNGSESVDIIDYRTTSDKELNHTSSQDKVVIDAVSPIMNVQFEYRTDTEYQITNNQLGDLRTDCTGMCFGIIERPHVEITLDKTIKNVKLTLSNGTNLVNGNPNDQNVSEHLTRLSDSYSKVEAQYTDLYGSTVTIDYNVKATNKSELDYATKEYYTKGIKGSATPVTTTLTKVIDYLSYKECKYVGVGENVHISDEYTNDEGYSKEDYYEEGILDSNKDYKNQLLITDEQNLTPQAANNGTYESNYTLTVSKLLSSTNTSDSLGWTSYSEIIGIKNVTFTPQYTSHMGSYVAGDGTPYPTGTSEADNAEAIIAITPPTGKDRSNFIYIVSAGVLAIIGIGIFTIKKFILK